MLVIKIELHPHGDATRAKTLVTGTIANTGTGTWTRGNYFVRLYDKAGRLWKTGTVEDFPRTRLLSWDLLTRALFSILGPRNKLQKRKTDSEVPA